MQCVESPSAADNAQDNASWNRIPELTAESFDDSLNADRYSMIEFYVPGCGSCEQMKDTVANLFSRYSEKMFFGKVKKDSTTPEIVAKYGAYASPTFVFFQSGAPDTAVFGMQTENTLASIIEQGLNETAAEE